MYAATERAAATVREPTDDELKFDGLNRGEIPSKSFQRLQSWTGTCKLYFIVIIIIIIMNGVYTIRPVV